MSTRKVIGNVVVTSHTQFVVIKDSDSEDNQVVIHRSDIKALTKELEKLRKELIK